MKLIRKFLYPIIILIIIILIIYSYSIKKELYSKKYDDIEIVKENNQVDDNKTIESKKYNIDIKGAITNPGVYQVENNYTVSDVIKLAGGLTNNADTSIINLAKKVTDEMVIIIYTKEEVKKSNIVDTVIKIVEKECVCPNIQNDGCINDKIDKTIGNDNSLVNINIATLKELQDLPGIGESKAKSIIDYREEKGNFTSIEDLKNVDGIGSLLYEQIKIYITT